MTSLPDRSPSPRPVIPVYRPDLSGNERLYVMECLETNWISSIGAFIPRFEAAVARATGVSHAIAVSNGTVALHLALHCLGIGPGDEVIVPTFTFIASVNTIAQTGAVPVFADSLPSDWTLDPADVERRITPRTKAIMAVHLYGAACDMPALLAIARRHNLKIVEDCAEAFGTTLGGRHVGTFGDVGAFSFFGNKTVTTGEGGMVICNDDALATTLRIAKGQGQSPDRRYWHECLGFNYRMTNIAAAIGLAQMERLPATFARKRAIAAEYRALLTGMPVTFQQMPDTVDPMLWLLTVLLPLGMDRERVIADMAAQSVETRPVFNCAHEMKMYASGAYGRDAFPAAAAISVRGISLPSYPSLSRSEMEDVVRSLRNALAAQSCLG
ncbi:MAG TPA: DegT/DnrJ/EryC1/StrS family aminotransferase [Alphaproteobacteria bacterium]|jgi:perosamine synthetase|nr:DegT/DnrJ/EryC1/StrS family aminotransferase [Alphaproteobacteria bacterium]